MPDPKPDTEAAASEAARSAALRALPAVGAVVAALAARPDGAAAADPELWTFLTREVLAARRQALREGRESTAPDLETVVAEVEAALARWRQGPEVCRVINATGVILHSGLGRAVLPEAAREALAAARGYVLLEVDRERGERRRRDAFLERLLCHLTGAEAAFVVNNNAAATFLLLNTLAAGKNVVVSRSQMVEIGGSFRLPEVFAMSGCELREVGTTNRSYAADYENAVDEATGALLLVHTSNYRLVGFTSHVEIAELVEIGRRVGRPVVHDLGSGALADPAVLGVGDEPPVARSVRAGADLVCFSGDKMIGGVQAGILVGKKAWIDRLRQNPLARALRIDKLTCLALESVLKLYLEPSRLCERIPALRQLTTPAKEIAERARDLAAALASRLGAAGAEASGVTLRLVASSSEMGSGAMPAVGIPTTCVALAVAGRPAQELGHALRLYRTPIFTRLQGEQVLVDPRTLLDGEAEEIVEAVAAILAI